MKIKRFVADSLPAAAEMVRAELGRDAVILDTRPVPAQGWRRLLRRFDRVQVSAAVESAPAALPGSPAAARPSPARRAANASAGPAPARSAPAGVPAPAAPPAAVTPAPARLDVREAATSDGLRQAVFAEGLAPGASGQPQAIRVRAGARRVVALVGPTGAGKTTTLAKLAAHLHLQQGWRVALVTADTFRVGAVDQLQAYARLLGLPCEVTPTPAALERALARLGDAEVVLVDTSGRSHHDARRMQELAAFVGAARAVGGADDAGGVEVHLVLAAPTRGAEARAIVAAYGAFADRLLLTKLDECEEPPEALAAAAGAGLPLSYCCAGQRVPEDLALAWPDRIAEGLGARGGGGGAAAVQRPPQPAPSSAQRLGRGRAGLEEPAAAGRPAGA